MKETDLQLIYSYRYTVMPPYADIALMIGDAIHNARSALDILLCDIARLRGKSTDNVKFPITQTKEDLRKRLLKSPFPRLGTDVSDAIMKTKPFRNGGNAVLRVLHEYDIIDKHELLLPSMAGSRTANEFGVMAFYGSTEARGKSVFGDEPRVGIVEGPLELWFLNNNYPESEVVPTLLNCANAVEEVIEAFASEFGSGD